MNILFFLTPKSEVAYIPANESLRQAFEKLKYHGYSAVPTLTDDGKYAGTITEGDVLRAMESMCHWNNKEARGYDCNKSGRKHDSAFPRAT